MRMYIHINTYICTHTFTHICISMNMCICVNKHVYTPVFLYMHILHICTHTYTHTHKLITHAPPLQRCVHAHADRQTSDKDSSSSDSSSSCIVRRPPRRRCTKRESACIPVFHAGVLNNEEILAICSSHGERGISSRPLRSGGKKIRFEKNVRFGKIENEFWGANSSWNFKASLILDYSTQANGIGVRICLFDGCFSYIEDARYVCVRVWITFESRQQRRECPKRNGARQNIMHARQLGQGPRRCCRGGSSLLGGCQLLDQIKTKHLCGLIMQYSCFFS